MNSNPELPTISIIMGVYNAQGFVQRAVDSILTQTYKNFELIICDDASTDNTLSIIEKYNDPRIKILKNEKNQGLGQVLNKCIEISKGKYIARQDADDYSDFDRLRIQLEYMQNNPEVDVLGCSAYLVGKTGLVWGHMPASQNFCINQWMRDVQIIHPTVLMKKEVLLKVGKYDPSAIRVEDYELWMRMLLKGVKFHNLKQCLFYYRLCKDDYKKKQSCARFKSIKIRLKYLAKFNYPLSGFTYILKNLILILTPKYFLYLYHRRKFSLDKAHQV